MTRVKAAIATHNAAGRKLQTNSPVALDIFIGLSKSQGKTKDDQYFKDALRWVEQKYGKENVLLAVIHRDETTPHAQCLVMPRIDGRFQASRILGGRDDFKKMQDSFFAAAGRPAGLDRGIRGSTAKHVKIRDFYTALSAGAKIPEIQKVPAAPGRLDRILKPAAAKKLADRRAAAIEANRARRQLIEQAARAAGQMHPDLVRRTADRYRQAKAAEAASKAHLQQAKQEAALAAADRRLATQVVEQPARLVAGALRLLDQSAVDKIAASLHVDLRAGVDLVDQLRKRGKCKTLAEGLELIRAAVEAAPPSEEREAAREAFRGPSAP